MKINYETTIDEIIDTQMLTLRGTNTYAKWKAWGVFYFIFPIFISVYFGDGPLINKILVGIFFGAVFGGRLIFNYKSIIRKRIRKRIVGKLGSDKPILATITMDDNKIEYGTDTMTTGFYLNTLENIEEYNEGIVLDFKMGGVLYIPSSAFSDDNEKHKWNEALHAKLNTVN